jgi:hypothetical protein
MLFARPDRNQCLAERVVELLEEAIANARNLARALNAVEVSKNGSMAALNDFACSTND